MSTSTFHYFKGANFEEIQTFGVKGFNNVSSTANK